MEIFGDFTPSLIRALFEIDPDYIKYDALVIAGSHSPKDVDETINKITEYRKAGKPIYGECYGHQLCVIEFARNILGIKDATSEEWGQGTLVIKKRPGLNVGLKEGESYWNNYEARPDILVEYHRAKPDNMITSQYHPSYQSSRIKPHQLLVKFIELCKSYEK